jgi:hypothetical protein
VTGSTIRPPEAAGLIAARGIPWARTDMREFDADLDGFLQFIYFARMS